MKCQDCHDRRFHKDKVARTKYITRAEVQPDGTISVKLGDCYIGKTYRVVIEEIPE